MNSMNPQRRITDQSDVDKAVLKAAFAKFDVIALSVALGTTFALLLFSATAFLLLKGPSPGTEVGEHLNLIGIYLPGYTVSWSGALLGALYVWVIGALSGFVLGLLWNMTHYIYIAMIVIRTSWINLMAD